MSTCSWCETECEELTEIDNVVLVDEIPQHAYQLLCEGCLSDYDF